MRRFRKILILFIMPALIFMLFFTLYPLIYNVIVSFQDITLSTLQNPKKEFVGFTNYINVMSKPEFWQVFKNSMVFTFGSISCQFIIGFALALFLVKKFPLSKFVRASIIVGWVLPPIVVGSVWKWILDAEYGVLNFFLTRIHLISEPLRWLSSPHNAMKGVLLANIWLGIPFFMLLFLGGITGLPEDVYEAADIDGANKLQKLVYLTIPMLKRTIAASLMLGTIFTFKVFGLIWIMTRGGPVNSTHVLPTYSYELAFEFFKISEGTAVANILLVIMLVFSVLYLRFLNREGEY